MSAGAHPELCLLRDKLQDIYETSAYFHPLALKPPILDTSIEINSDPSDDSSWTHQDQIPGLRQLRESIRLDLDVLDKFLDNAQSVNLPPLSTNAPYLITVWNELICAKRPVVGVFKTFDDHSTTDRTKRNGKIPGVKVDIVAENGRRWIRVNTIKNSRILSEFREIDSYLTDDESDGEIEGMPPTLAQVQFDNSVLRMARSLAQTAKATPIQGTNEIPRITLRLTRLNPSPTPESGERNDPRITQTITCLEEMGIEVELGERSDAELEKYLPSHPPSLTPATSLRPTRRIGLDLSALIALISDLTHFPLPKTLEEANARFIPPQEYREWKEKRSDNKKPQDFVSLRTPERSVEDLPKIYVKQARALTRQLLQEMIKGMIQEMHDQLTEITCDDLSSVEFWTTPEARTRCLLIVSKIGGESEKRRVQALFNHGNDLQAGIEAYWKGSRYPTQFIPILPIRLFPSSSDPEPAEVIGQENYSNIQIPAFMQVLKKTCKYILEQDIIPNPRINNVDHNTVENQDQQDEDGEIQRAAVTKINPKLTAHTVQSMLWGAELGWTTLTGNKTSVKAIMREIRAARVTGRLSEEEMEVCALEKRGGRSGEEDEVAALWVVDPRSLAEGMSSLSAA